jgi:hypothetical protein
MDRLTNRNYNDIIKCQDCIEESNCYENSCGQIEKAIHKLRDYENLECDGLLLKLPCKVGDVIYIVTTCKTFPPKLDGTMWDSDGGFGTATGYYCPYEDSNLCPFINCEDPDCSYHENELGIFEDVVCHICIEEDKMWFVCENSNGWELSDFGKTIFLARKGAELMLVKTKQ